MAKNKGENYLGNVVRIIDEKSLIIDVGDDYLSIGDKVVIYFSRPSLLNRPLSREI